MSKPGRKPQGEFQGRTKVYSARLTPETKAALDRAAAESGRSVSQEVEHRLRQTLESERTVEEMFGGPAYFAIAQVLAQTMRLSGWNGENRPSADDDEVAMLRAVGSFAHVRAAVNAVLDALDPARPQATPDAVPLAGEAVAATIADAVFDPQTVAGEPAIYHWARVMNARLGGAITPLRGNRQRMPLSKSAFKDPDEEPQS